MLLRLAGGREAMSVVSTVSTTGAAVAVEFIVVTKRNKAIRDEARD